MTGQIEFTFEELPLKVESGFACGLVNGSATISYYEDGEWFIRSIALDGHRKSAEAERDRHGLFVRQSVEIDRDTDRSLFLIIWDRLQTGSFNSDITDAVAEALEGEGVSLVPDSREHSTHHPALAEA